MEIGGTSLLSRLLGGLGSARTVVVAGAVPVPTGTLRVVEDPPGTGPVAGIAAGCAAIADPAPWVLVLAVDQPGAAHVIPVLLDAAAQAGPEVHGLCPVDPTGHRQLLLAAYRAPALRAAIGELPVLAGASVRSLTARMQLALVDVDPDTLGDVDTPEDLRRWQAVPFLDDPDG